MSELLLAKDTKFAFYLPTPADIAMFANPGDNVKVVFSDGHGNTEAIWVAITSVEGDKYVGKINNDSRQAFMIAEGKVDGATVRFETRHICQVYTGW